MIYMELCQSKAAEAKKVEGEQIYRQFYRDLFFNLDLRYSGADSFAAAVERLPISALKTELRDYLKIEGFEKRTPPLELKKSIAEKDLINLVQKCLKQQPDRRLLKSLVNLEKRVFFTPARLSIDSSTLALALSIGALIAVFVGGFVLR